MFLLGFILPGTLCFLDLVDYFLSHVSGITSSYIFSGPLSLSSFWDPYNANVGEFNVVPLVSWAALVAQLVRNPPAIRETWVLSLGWKKGKGYPLQYSGLENSMDLCPWGHKESDMTE